jgi:uncharacterized membrane protein YeiH
MEVSLSGEAITYALDLVGILLGALLGAQVAIRERFDVTGTVTLAIVCGVGGGVIRDVLVAAGPPLALTRAPYLTTAVVGATVMLVADVSGSRHGARLLVHGDALLLGFFTAAGCQRAADAGLPLLAVGMLGVITAVGGGMLRDLLVGQPPAVLQGGTLYATVAIVAAACFIALDALDVRRGIMVAVCIVVGYSLRMSALHWKIETPTTPQPLGPRRVVRRLRDTERAGLFRRRRRKDG